MASNGSIEFFTLPLDDYPISITTLAIFTRQEGRYKLSKLNLKCILINDFDFTKLHSRKPAVCRYLGG